MKIDTGKKPGKGMKMLLLAGALVLLLLAVLSPGREKAEPENPTEETTVLAVEDLIISTPFCDLRFPGQWADRIRTETVEADNGDVQVFYGKVNEKETVLFAVLFSRDSDTSGELVGLLQAGEDVRLVSILGKDAMDDPSWTQAECDAVARMREGADYLAEQLRTLPGFSEDYDAFGMEKGTGDLEIETPFCTLRYPEARKEWIWTEFVSTGSGGCVTFYGMVSGTDVKLFDVYFGVADDAYIPVGYLSAADSRIPVSFCLYQPEEMRQWGEKDLELIARMQEDLNDLLEALSELPEFTYGAAADLEGYITVPTVYGNLYFPSQWEEVFTYRVETVDNGGAVVFSAVFGDKTADLFTVFFGVESAAGVEVGTLQERGKRVSVVVELAEFIPGAVWTDQETEAVCAMQECVNDVVDKLQELKSFQGL